jgi:hypothetical protein
MLHTEATEIKARLLKAVLEKHPPQETKSLAFKLMQNYKSDSKEFKAFSALYEVMDILK